MKRKGGAQLIPKALQLVDKTNFHFLTYKYVSRNAPKVGQFG
jgi:hypothetical protein